MSINGFTIRSDIMIHNNFEVNNKETSSGVFNFVNLIYTNVFLVYHLKTSENLQFSGNILKDHWPEISYTFSTLT